MNGHVKPRHAELTIETRRTITEKGINKKKQKHIDHAIMQKNGAEKLRKINSNCCRYNLQWNNRRTRCETTRGGGARPHVSRSRETREQPKPEQDTKTNKKQIRNEWRNKSINPPRTRTRFNPGTRTRQKKTRRRPKTTVDEKPVADKKKKTQGEHMEMCPR